MKRFVIYLFLFIVFFFSADMHAQEKKKSVDNIASTELILSTDGNIIRVQNALKNSSVEVYNVLGVKITSIKIDSSDQTITLNLPKGCYILKIEEIVRKIAIK